MRLHIGASPRQIAIPEFNALRSGNWIHLGEPEPLLECQLPVTNNSSSDRYLSFYYKISEKLPFADQTFTFGFFENFFENLFLDEAFELLKECFRMMRPDAILRVAVSDADLRNYMAPEPAGYTTGDDRWFHPDKHKTRWSIYGLNYVLSEIGFHTRGLVDCDKFGQYLV